MVNGTPKALAARARISSAPQRPALMPPVGAMASGRLDCSPKIAVAGVDLRHVDQHLGQQAHALEGGAVLAQRHLVLGAAVEEVEDRARQAPLRDAAQVLDVDRVRPTSA